MGEKIKGGYVLLARSIGDSLIANAAPSVREIWIWLVRQAYYKDETVCGRQFKRGQCFINYQDIMDGLKWFVGFRKMTYKKHHCENAMKWLVKEGMITTTKTARGLVVTVCNYDTYQCFDNYENYKKAETEATGSQRQSDSKDNEVKSNKEDSNSSMSDSTNQTGQILGLFGESDSTAGKPKESKSDEKETLFEDCWNLWQFKVSKKKSLTAFEKMITKNKKAPSKDALISAIENYNKSLALSGYKCAHFSTWLNGERWNDELNDSTPQVKYHSTPNSQYDSNGKKRMIV